MKRLFALLFITCAVATAAKAQNPYEGLGKEAEKMGEVLTLSNGRFEEMFDNEVIVQIGSALYNTETRKVIGFVEHDTLYSEATLEPEVVSRWLSPDPLAREFPSLSPYNFVENNPIRLIDPTGMSPNDYSVDDQGNVQLERKTDDNFDVLYKKGDESNQVKINDQTILPQLAQERPGENQKDWITNTWDLEVNYAISGNGKEVQKTFEFVASNSNVEWTLQGNRTEEGNRFIIGTVHQNAQAFSVSKFQGFERNSILIHAHSHPNSTKDDFTPSGNDRASALRTFEVNPNAKYYVYAPKLTVTKWNETYPSQKITTLKSKYIPIVK